MAHRINILSFVVCSSGLSYILLIDLTLCFIFDLAIPLAHRKVMLIHLYVDQQNRCKQPFKIAEVCGSKLWHTIWMLISARNNNKTVPSISSNNHLRTKLSI